MTVSVGWFLALRFTVAVLPLLSWIIWRRPRIPWRPAIFAGICLFFAYDLQTQGLVFTGPDRAAFITGFSVLAIPVVNYLGFRLPVRSVALVSTVGMLVGLAVFVGRQSPLNAGDALVFLAALFFAVQVVATALVPDGYSWLGFVTVELSVTALLAWMTVPFEPRPDFTWSLMGAVAYTGVIATTLAILGQTWGQTRIPALQAGMIFIFEPVFAMLVLVAFWHQAVTMSQAFGAVLMIAALAFYEWSGSRTRSA